jgi:ATP-binding cassette subfamily B protein
VLERDAALGGFLAQNGLDFAAALLAVVVAMLAVKLISLLLGAIKDACMATAVPRVVRDIKSQVFGAINRLPLSFYYNRETGSLMTRVLSDADQVSTLFIDNLPTVFIDLITIIGAAVMLFYINWVIAVAMLVVAPAAILITRGVMARLSTMHSRRHRAERSMSSHINDNLTGARVIKAFGRESGEMGRFAAGNDKLRSAEVDIITVESRMGAAFQLVGTMSNTLIFGIGAFLILSAATDLGYSDLITVSMYAGMLSGPLGNIARLMQQWAQSMNSAERIFEIIDAKTDILESEKPVKLDNVRGDVTLRNVRFSYTRGEPVLEDINLDIRAGELLGVVGRSGAGKSTLVNLISRLYDPDEGEILIDGVNIKDLSFETLRGLVSMVSQETYIFMGTVAENIAYARPDATRDEIVRAAVSAGAHDFICKLPDGYDTVIGTSGRELSGGERQRLSIARAVLTDPRILILDEATASVDTQTELAIQLSLDRLTEGRTTISIAHRLSTLRTADRLIVLEDGKLVESGTHAELLEKGGVFSHLAELQRKALMMKGLDE